jgi:hypothetical protein
MDINKFFQSKAFKGIICGIAAFLILLFVLKVGIVIGTKKADFSCRWSDNYHQNFGGPPEGFWGGFGDKDFIEASGTFGQIAKIDGSTVVIKSRNDVEKIILIDNSTIIKSLKKTVKSSDLKVDDYVVVVGEPNATGQIEAKLIRIMPPPGEPSGQMPPPASPH